MNAKQSATGAIHRRPPEQRVLKRMVLYYATDPEIRAGLAQWSSVSMTNVRRHWRHTM